MAGSFGERFDLAGRAIAAIILEALPDLEGEWPNIKPYDDTGMNVPVWLATAETIINELNSLIHPDQISIPENVVKEHGGKFLYEFQLYLAAIIP